MITYYWYILWYNSPSIAGFCTIFWDVKSYVVITKCNGRSYVIVLLILPLHHLKCTFVISLNLRKLAQRKQQTVTQYTTCNATSQDNSDNYSQDE